MDYYTDSGTPKRKKKKINNFQAVTPPAAECQQFERKQSNRIALKQTLVKRTAYDTELLPTIHLALQVV